MAGRGSTYVLAVDGTATERRVNGRSPAKALREMVEAEGMELASQDGRYGKLADGRSVSALTVAWSRVHNSDHGTTRV